MQGQETECNIEEETRFDDFKCELFPEPTPHRQKICHLLKEWGAVSNNSKVIYVFVGDNSPKSIWERLCKIAEKIQKYKVDVFFYVFCTPGWLIPCGSRLIETKCIVFPIDHSYFWGAEPEDLQRYTLTKQKELLSKDYDLEIFSKFIVTLEFNPVVPKCLKTKPIALVFQSDAIHQFESWYDPSKENSFFAQIFYSSNCPCQENKSGLNTKFIPFTAGLNDVLFIELMKHFAKERYNILYSHSHGMLSGVSTGTLYSYNKLNSLEIKICKGYQIVETIKQVTLSGIKLADKTNTKSAPYQLHITIDKSQKRDGPTKLDSVFDLIKSIQHLSEDNNIYYIDIEIIIYDYDCLLFQTETKSWSIDDYFTKVRRVRCIAVVPFINVYEKFKKKTLRDNNTFVDHYIFVRGPYQPFLDSFLGSNMPNSNSAIRNVQTLNQVHIRLHDFVHTTGQFDLGLGRSRDCTSYKLKGYSGPDCRELFMTMLRIFITNDIPCSSSILSTSCKDIGDRLHTDVDWSLLILRLCICVIIEAKVDNPENDRKLLGDTIGSFLYLYVGVADSASNNELKTRNALQRKILRFLLRNKCVTPESCVLQEIQRKSCETCEGDLVNLEHRQIKGVFSDYFLTNEEIQEKVKSDYRKVCPWKPLVWDDFSPIDPHFPTVVFLAAVHGGLPVVAESLLKATKPHELIANAMYAVGVFRNKKNLSTPLTQKLKESADKIETLASSILHDLHMEKRVWSRKILFEEIKRYDCDAFDLAYQAYARVCLSSAACTETIRRRWWHRSYKHHNTFPALNFITHLISYLALAVFYSYILLTGMNDGFHQTLEPILLVWMITILIDQIWQFGTCLECVSLGKRTFFENLRKRRKQYFSNLWNRWDILLITLFWIGYCLRTHALVTDNSNYHIASHFFFAMNIFTVYIRLLQFCAIFDEIGPLLITIVCMIGDLCYFASIMLAFLISYAIALILILKEIPSFKYLFFIPYFQIFGELRLDEIMNTNDWFNSTIYNNSLIEIDDIIMAGPRNYIAIIFTSVYVLMTQILLLNLLIAKFSSTYKDVASESSFIHIKHKISIMNEYKRASIVPPPFNVLYVFYMLITCVCGCKCLCHNNKVNPERSKSDEEKSFNEAIKRTLLKHKELHRDTALDMILNRLKSVENKINILNDV